jgi:hypothetical protein
MSRQEPERAEPVVLPAAVDQQGDACMWDFGRDRFDAFRFFALQLPCTIFGSLLGTLGAVGILRVLGV